MSESKKLAKVGDVLQLALTRPPAGLLTPEQAAARDGARAQSAGREQRLEHLRRSGIAKHLGRDGHGRSDVDRIVRDDVRPSDALALVQVFAAPERTGTRRWLFVSGGTGVGKTFAAAWLLARDGGVYVTVHELVEKHAGLLRGRAPTTLDEIRERLERIATARVLVLDELGQENDAPAFRAALHWLVEARASLSQANRYTLILSNMSADEVRVRFTSGVYDSRTESRLRPLARRRADGGGVHEMPKSKDRRGTPL